MAFGTRPVFLKMNCCKLLIIFLFISKIATAQDILVLKSNRKVVQTWFSGQSIELQLTSKQWISARIHKIQNDSLYLRPFVTQVLANRWGMPYEDTTFYGALTVGINDIYAFPKTEESVPYIRNGFIFQVGAAGYLALNLINTLRDGDAFFGKDNLPNVLIATGVLAVGTVMHMLHKSTLVLGKKYHVEYISSKPS